MSPLLRANFGPLSNTLLISNNSVRGTINAFDPVTGKFVGTIRDEHGEKIVLNNLWGVAFGGGTTTNGAAKRVVRHRGSGDWHLRIGRHLCKNRVQSMIDQNHERQT